jgi:hypothetical protein
MSLLFFSFNYFQAVISLLTFLYKRLLGILSVRAAGMLPSEFPSDGNYRNRDIILQSELQCISSLFPNKMSQSQADTGKLFGYKRRLGENWQKR